MCLVPGSAGGDRAQSSEAGGAGGHDAESRRKTRQQKIEFEKKRNRRTLELRYLLHELDSGRSYPGRATPPPHRHSGRLSCSFERIGLSRPSKPVSPGPAQGSAEMLYVFRCLWLCSVIKVPTTRGHARRCFFSPPFTVVPRAPVDNHRPLGSSRPLSKHRPRR